ncbi:MAG TPA: hypothetical protein VHQ92_10495 [Pseudolabrys sp.]|jgi:hypothetical protein|nr:hypothetical protein [Pseudolabrys sp.]
MLLEPLFGLSLVLSVSLDFQTPLAEAGAWVSMSTRQRDAKLLPLVQEATACIVRRAFADPRYNTDLRPGEINDLIVDSMAGCVKPVRAMIDAHDRMYGSGSGEAFLLGPYLDVLPAAVVGQVKVKAHDR